MRSDIPDSLGERIVAVLGEPAAHELLDVLTRPPEERVAVIGKLHARSETRALAESLIDLEEDEPARLRFTEARGVGWETTSSGAPTTLRSRRQ